VTYIRCDGDEREEALCLQSCFFRGPLAPAYGGHQFWLSLQTLLKYAPVADMVVVHTCDPSTSEAE
jgi:hypothetical protein